MLNLMMSYLLIQTSKLSRILGGELIRSPLFVTWNLVTSNGGKKLRGCIGTFEPLPLAQGLKSYAITA